MSRNIISGGHQRDYGSQRSSRLNTTRDTFTSNNRSFNSQERKDRSKTSRVNMKERSNQYPLERNKASNLKQGIFSHKFNSIFN